MPNIYWIYCRIIYEFIGFKKMRILQIYAVWNYFMVLRILKLVWF